MISTKGAYDYDTETFTGKCDSVQARIRTVNGVKKCYTEIAEDLHAKYADKRMRPLRSTWKLEASMGQDGANKMSPNSLRARQIGVLQGIQQTCTKMVQYV